MLGRSSEFKGPLSISYHRNLDGVTFGLDKAMRRLLADHFGSSVNPKPRIFFETQADLSNFPNLRAAVILLTGVPEEALQELGKILFIDPATNLPLGFVCTSQQN